MAENCEARLKQANTVNKTDFNNKLTRDNKRITYTIKQIKQNI